MTSLVQRATVHKRLFALYDENLDQAKGIRWLKQPAVAEIVRANLYHHDGVKYNLLAYCIMPNHVHVLLLPLDRSAGGPPALLTSTGGPPALLTGAGEPPALRDISIGDINDGQSPLAKIMHSLKSYTAHEANKVLGRSGAFWQAESYDHWVRDEEELERIVNYIAENPIKAGLVENPQDWLFCSVRDRFLRDGELTGWLA